MDAITATLTSTLTVRDTPRDTKGLTRGGEGGGRGGEGGELPIFSFISPSVSKSLSEFFCPKNRFPLFPSRSTHTQVQLLPFFLDFFFGCAASRIASNNAVNKVSMGKREKKQPLSSKIEEPAQLSFLPSFNSYRLFLLLLLLHRFTAVRAARRALALLCGISCACATRHQPPKNNDNVKSSQVPTRSYSPHTKKEKTPKAKKSYYQLPKDLVKRRAQKREK